MTMRTSCRVLTIAALLLGPLAARAVDAPHDPSMTTGSCVGCHDLANGAGGNGPTPNTVCTSCHSAVGSVSRLMSDAEQAVPATGGVHHRWDSVPTVASAGALTPLHPFLNTRLPSGRVQCATCHDPHQARAANVPATISASLAVGTAVSRTGPVGAATQRMVLQPLPANPTPQGYRIKVTATGFIISHDAQATNPTPTWLNFVGGVWTAGVDNGQGRPIALNTDLALDGANPLTIRFTSALPVAGDFWDFYVSYPFVRAYSPPDQICIDCHRDRYTDHLTTRGAPGYGWAAGARRHSHPVYQGLGENAEGYDRAAPIDANGGAAGSDGNPSNDLVLTNGQVTCLTCHSVHHADSNSISDDSK